MSVWSQIETAPESAALFSWRLRFGDALPQVAAWFLKKGNGTARTVPCPRRCGCIHRVIEGGSAVCECGDCDDIQLTPEDLAIWKPNWARLGEGIGDAFDLQRKTAEFPVPKVWQIGTYGAEALPIVLIVQPDRVAFNEALAQLVARIKAFVALTPTASHIDIASRELVGRANAGLVDLQSNVQMLSSGRFQALRTSRELFDAYLTNGRENRDESKAASRDYCIREERRRRRRGKQDKTQVSTWRIWFRGHETLIPESLGSEYLVFLIRNQSREFEAGVLIEAVRKSVAGRARDSIGTAREVVGRNDAGGDESRDLRGRVGEVNERDVIWDRREIAECLRRIKALREEIQAHDKAGERSSEGYLALKENLEKQQDLLRANAKQVNGKWLPKEYQKGTFMEKADVIRKHFRKLLDEHLRAGCRPLFDHLNDKDTLNYGVRNLYRPKPRIEWTIELIGGQTGT